MVDFVEIDDFFAASGTFLSGDGDLDCDNSATTAQMSGGYETSGSTPDYQFSPDLAPYGSPDSYGSDDGTLVPASMQVETAPQFESAEPPKLCETTTGPVSEGVPPSFNPFEGDESILVGKATTNPLYDSSEALNQLHLMTQQAQLAQPQTMTASTGAPQSVAVSTPTRASASPSPSASSPMIAPSSKKKRKASKSSSSIKQEEAIVVSSPSAALNPAFGLTPSMVQQHSSSGVPRLTFTPRDPGEGIQYAKMFDGDQEIVITGFHVEADKGFNYSPIDNAFVCQKKNHFQVSAAMTLSGKPNYVYMAASGQYAPITALRLAVWGLKDEDPPTSVGIEQSHVDRSKKPFMPVEVELDPSLECQATFQRLHFCETTANNMRKKGKPNPEQRYFKLLVELHALVDGNDIVSIYCEESQQIIVRASNPGQFEGETEMKWQKGKVMDSIVHHGPVGINTDRPFSALTVSGDVSVTGNIMHPSDLRIKEQLNPMNNQQQLDNVRALRLYEYQVRQPWAEATGRNPENRREVGVIAQNVQRVLPDAVVETGANIELKDGSSIDNLLIVDKDRIFMENVGAVQELCRMSENMDLRIRELEILKESVTSGIYNGDTIDGDFQSDRPKRRTRRRGSKKGDNNATAGEWETLTQPGWSQIPVKRSKEPFPIERLLCYVISVLTIFALLIIIVVLIAQQDGSDGSDKASDSSTLPSVTPFSGTTPMTPGSPTTATATLTTLTSALTATLTTMPP
eukprot:m.160206 g.160206  ORF g.160206 m.160206 type:complete len:743 (-) comp11915_c0_seq1:224-2452(-)